MLWNAVLLVVGLLAGGLLVVLWQRRAVTKNADEGLFQLLSEHTPVALLLYSGDGTIRFANHRAEALLFSGQKLAGEDLLRLLRTAPASVREALLTSDDAVFTLDYEGEQQTFQTLRRELDVADQAHVLLLINPLTKELSRREVAMLKRVVRVISHELNNSLASISSLLSSGRLIAKNPEHLPRLEQVFSGLEERTSHLKSFLGQYAALARLPEPRSAEVEWKPLLNRLQQLFPNVHMSEAPAEPGWFDETQLEQVLINLLKNAVEAGGPPQEVELLIRERGGELHLGVLDRGPGFSNEALQQGLLPFYSTKPNGSGVGLALCREVAEGHGGRLRVTERQGGGAAVYCVLPGRTAPKQPQPAGAISLTRT